MIHYEPEERLLPEGQTRMTIMVSTETKHLVELLQKLEKIQVLPNDSHCFLRDEGKVLDEETEQLIDEIVVSADTALITNDGSCRFDQHELLKRVGFNVTPGETDSFGWLSGVIHTCKGKIVYG